MSNKVECVVCGKEVDLLDKFNGEIMCDKCYKEELVFGEEGE